MFFTCRDWSGHEGDSVHAVRRPRATRARPAARSASWPRAGTGRGPSRGREPDRLEDAQRDDGWKLPQTTGREAAGVVDARGEGYGDGLTDRIRELAPGGIDAAGGGALPALVELAGDAKRVVTIADYAGADETGARFSGGIGTERAIHALRNVGPLIETGKFSLPVAQTFPLEKIGDAHALSEEGHVRGKLVLLVNEAVARKRTTGAADILADRSRGPRTGRSGCSRCSWAC
jgi:Zinc-binding dehydrogenase